MRIEIIKDTIAIRTSIEIEDGKMKISREEVRLDAGDIYDASGDETNLRAPKDGKIEIKMQDNSSLSEIPIENLKIKTLKTAKGRKKGGCGSCGKRRRQ